MKTIAAICGFLRQQYDDHNGKDLLDFYLRHEGALETQVNVAAGTGRPVPGRTSTYTDGINEWWSIRIPKKADSEPEWTDYHLKWPLEMHAEAIGSTGWDWRAKLSRYVGFDFDSIAGHAQGVGVTDESLDKVRQAAQDLPYVTTRRSTGGAGIHLYVFFADGVPTTNHTEHAALARCVLGMMSAEAGFNFAAQIDACGGNMWLYHKKSSKENRGLELIRAGEPLARVPSNWRDHVEVVSRKRAKVKLVGIDDQASDAFDKMACAYRAVPLDDQHHAHIAHLEKSGFCCVWVQDHNLLQTHTVGFQQIADDPQYGVKGFYKTNSNGSDPATPNCFAFPGPDGSWKICRFSPGIAEAETWEQDGQGYTTCIFNRPAKLKTAARVLKAKDLKKGYEFDTLADAAKALEAAGLLVDVDEVLKDRKAIVKTLPDGRLSVQVEKAKPTKAVKAKGDQPAVAATPGDPDVIGQWSNADNKGMWAQIFDAPDQPDADGDPSMGGQTDRVRALESPNGQSIGWALLKDNNQWSEQSAPNVTAALLSLGFTKPDAEITKGIAVRNAWTLVKLPFQPEYPGGRQWNLRAPQFRFPPAPRSDSDVSQHPTWDAILAHIGVDLDAALKAMPWAQRANVLSGADYLRLWLACLIRDPFYPLPYLFLFGDENTGKTSLWQAFDKLVTNGVVRAERALTSTSDFNAELDGAILCIVDERDLTKAKGASERLRDAVTSQKLSVRKMRTDSYQVPNMTHWIQTGNNLKYCPVFPGDTRVTMISVGKLTTEIPTKILDERIEAEGPAFLRTLLDLPLPTVEGRLRIPVVNTEHKKYAESINRSALDQFLLENTFHVLGEKMLFSDFYDKFHAWLPIEEAYAWSKIRVAKSLPVKYPAGTGNSNKKYIGNIAWEAGEGEPSARLVVRDGRLVKE